MNNLIFIIFIVVIFIFQALGQVLTKRQKQTTPQGEKPSKGKTIEDILKTLGFPPIEEEPPAEVIVEKKKEEKPKIEKAVGGKPQEEEKTVPALAEKLPEKEFLPLDKLEEAIIYSTIIGPPKAYQIRRGAGIGLQAGLKNR